MNITGGIQFTGFDETRLTRIAAEGIAEKARTLTCPEHGAQRFARVVAVSGGYDVECCCVAFRERLIQTLH